MFESGERMLLAEKVDIVWIFHLVHERNNLFRSESHAQTYGCAAPSLAHGVEHDEVRIVGKIVAEWSLRREVAIGLVNDYDAMEIADYLFYFVAVEVVARRIVRRANPDELGVAVGGSKKLVGMQLEFVVEEYWAIFHIINIRTHAIHAVCRLYSHHVVYSRLAEYAVRQVDSLVAAIAEKHTFCSHTFYLCQFSL